MIGALLAAYHEGGAGTNTAIAFALIGTFLTIQTGNDTIINVI